MSPRSGPEEATFAAGHFWDVEEAFRRVPGVLATAAGYTGGYAANPTFPQVAAGGTGHMHAVRVRFDPAKLRYEQLLAVFWRCHDPTERAMPAQHRSAIFYHSAAQMAAADRSKAEARHRFARPVLTRVLPAGLFHRAEEEHQHYLLRLGGGNATQTR